MKTNQFCKLFEMPRDRLRFYREHGLLYPEKENNGYFEYKTKDIASLYFALDIKKKYEHSIESIRNQMENELEPNVILRELQFIDEELSEINEEIKRLNRKKEILQALKVYRTQLLETINQIVEIEWVDGLTYFKEEDFIKKYQDVRKLAGHALGFQGLFFQTEQLNNEIIYPTYIIGILDKAKNDNKVVFSSGSHIPCGKRAIRYTVILDNLKEIPSSTFLPVIEFAKNKHIKLFPFVTSLMLDVQTKPEKYVVMFRFLIDEN